MVFRPINYAIERQPFVEGGTGSPADGSLSWVNPSGTQISSMTVGGVATDVYVPVAAVLGIYARENGQGMVFEPEEPGNEPPPEPTPEPDKRPALKVVK